MISTTSRNIAGALGEAALSRPDAMAVAYPAGRITGGRVPYREMTFAGLHRESDQLARGLRASGFAPGMRTVLMVTPGREFFALTFALFKAGIVPVMVDPGMGLKSLRQCLDEAGPEGFIGVTKAHAARVALGWAKGSVKHLVTVGPRLGWGGASLDGVLAAGASSEPWTIAEAVPGETCAILFTSGSTGLPKGVEYTHEHFQAQVEAIRAAYGIEPGEVDLCTFPLFALFAPALGMSAVVPAMDATRPAKADPRLLVQAMNDYRATNAFGSPALLDVLGRHHQRTGAVFPHLRRIISAGAPMPARILRALTPALAPGTQVFPGYGATEAMPLCTMGSDEILGETWEATELGGGICVGKPLPGVELRIIRISDDAIPEWDPTLELPSESVGEICVRGPMVTRRYFRRPEAGQLAKIADGGTFWHRMGDLGTLDPLGRLWYCGRKAHRVETRNGTLFSDPCEAVFNSHPAVWRTALTGLGPRGSQEPVLCVQMPGNQGRLGERFAKMRPVLGETPSLAVLRRELLEIGGRVEQTRGITRIVFFRWFPVDVRHNSKIGREQLAAIVANLPRGTE